MGFVIEKGTRKTQEGAATPGELLGRPDGAAAAALGGPGPLAWAALAPRGLYGNGGQRLLCLGLTLFALPFALVLGVPVALVNLAYFRDPRRVFFAQERVGRFGRRFRIVKFRTMTEAPRSLFESWSGSDHLRVTPFGRFLRNTHLDELPQLWNVLRGDMSLFGPRPEMVEVHEWACEHVPEFPRRLAVLPGLTGLSQVTQGYAGRDVDAYRTKLEGDLEYVARLGLRQDLALLARTAVWVLRGRGWLRVPPR